MRKRVLQWEKKQKVCKAVINLQSMRTTITNSHITIMIIIIINDKSSSLRKKKRRQLKCNNSQIRRKVGKKKGEIAGKDYLSSDWFGHCCFCLEVGCWAVVCCVCVCMEQKRSSINSLYWLDIHADLTKQAWVTEYLWQKLSIQSNRLTHSIGRNYTAENERFLMLSFKDIMTTICMYCILVIRHRSRIVATPD